MNLQPDRLIQLHWNHALEFTAEVPSGTRLEFDAFSDEHPHPSAPSPLEALLASAAACSAMDVISILAKMHQTPAAYRVEVQWTRHESGEWPHPITDITLRHVFSGEQLKPESVAHAVELSDTKYCSVVATLRSAPTVTSSFAMEPAAG